MCATRSGAVSTPQTRFLLILADIYCSTSTLRCNIQAHTRAPAVRGRVHRRHRAARDGCQVCARVAPALFDDARRIKVGAGRRTFPTPPACKAPALPAPPLPPPPDCCRPAYRCCFRCGRCTHPKRSSQRGSQVTILRDRVSKVAYPTGATHEAFIHVGTSRVDSLLVLLGGLQGRTYDPWLTPQAKG